MQKTVSHIKYFLKAKSPVALQHLMLKNSIRTKHYHDYRIVYADGFWFAWYEHTADDLIKDELNGNESGDKR